MYQVNAICTGDGNMRCDAGSFYAKRQQLHFNPRPAGPLDFPRPAGGGVVDNPPSISAPMGRIETIKKGFESSSKIISKVLRSIFR